MEPWTLIIGNKNYSSWSLRAWLVLKHAGVPFEEQLVLLDRPDSSTELAKASPSRRVPVLRIGDLSVWDSLAIAETVAERAPAAGLWPADPDARALARAVTCEMHSGFAALREHMPMNVRRHAPGMGRKPGVAEDIARIQALWGETRARFGAGGPLLFGAFTIADAFFAPVVSRFVTYEVEVDASSRAYMDAIWALPAMEDWRTAAAAETSASRKYDL
ncbi:MAG: glutathione S-transferase family protein [Polyangiaceae bacterium]